MIKALLLLMTLGGIAALLVMRQRKADIELRAEFEAAPSWTKQTSQEPVAASETSAG